MGRGVWIGYIIVKDVSIARKGKKEGSVYTHTLLDLRTPFWIYAHQLFPNPITDLGFKHTSLDTRTLLWIYAHLSNWGKCHVPPPTSLKSHISYVLSPPQRPQINSAFNKKLQYLATKL